MALRSIHVMQGIVADMEAVCPDARIVQLHQPDQHRRRRRSRDHTDIPLVSLCEGPDHRSRASSPAPPTSTRTGSTRSWSGSTMARGACATRTTAQDADAAVARGATRASATTRTASPRRGACCALATVMDSIPADYFQYYYFKDEVLAELQSQADDPRPGHPGAVPGYWQHYREQADSDRPVLDPDRSRGGIHELELAIDVHGRRLQRPQGDAAGQRAEPRRDPRFPRHARGGDARQLRRNGDPAAGVPGLPRQVRGPGRDAGRVPQAAAEAAWSGDARDAVRALPRTRSCARSTTPSAIYDELAAAHRVHLPERLLPA